MTGWICTSVTPFFDVKTKTQGFKSRPVLVIGQADSEDYAVLPISRVTNSAHLSNVYDIKIDPAIFPCSGLTQVSYVRTHKQIFVNNHAITGKICDLKTTYPDLYLEIAVKLEEYNKVLLDNII